MAKRSYFRYFTAPGYQSPTVSHFLLCIFYNAPVFFVVDFTNINLKLFSVGFKTYLAVVDSWSILEWRVSIHTIPDIQKYHFWMSGMGGPKVRVFPAWVNSMSNGEDCYKTFAVRGLNKLALFSPTGDGEADGWMDRWKDGPMDGCSGWLKPKQWLIF